MPLFSRLDDRQDYEDLLLVLLNVWSILSFNLRGTSCVLCLALKMKTRCSNAVA
jgi:hypothetical protein